MASRIKRVGSASPGAPLSLPGSVDIVPFDPNEVRDIRQTRLAGDGPTVSQT